MFVSTISLACFEPLARGRKRMSKTRLEPAASGVSFDGSPSATKSSLSCGFADRDPSVAIGTPGACPF